ncbi:MAG TPA: SDR family oxidoreductase [Pseudonocardiaceae bacterium]|nr:SDR family oxidoreductase [Pseudonocardiaceae bacterium]
MNGSTNVVLVTGAAGDIGQSLCQGLSARGYLVVGWDIAPKPDSAPVVHWEQLDLTGDVSGAAVAALDNLGSLRYVFHVVGGSDVDELAQADTTMVPMEVFQRTVALNLFSAYVVVRATISLLRQSNEDRGYTFVSSLNAMGGYRAPGYSAAKAGLHGLTKALAVPLGMEGVRVNTVAFGTTRTANYSRLAEMLGRTADFEHLGTRFPRGSVLTPIEAAVALMSIGLDNPALSGQVVAADAAQHLLRP